LVAQNAEDKNSRETPVDQQRVVLGGDGEVVSVRFEVTPAEPGRTTYRLRTAAPAEDRNSRDNQQAVDVEVVGRQSRVLLVAGGPTREYRFLRNQLWRDKDVRIDVLLQSASHGIAQDADQVLDEFPRTREELYQYDAMVAFDPDWAALDVKQTAILEQWVAQEGGGLIAIAGPIHTGSWTRKAETATILDLYPVHFQRRFSLLDESPLAAGTVSPVVFTRDGLEAEFLWLAETAAASQAAWSAFSGIFGCWPVKEAKPGATVYGHYAHPEASVDDKPPIYLAEQFYGSGRVFYLGSGEMWRLRSVDEAYFEVFYTKLIRHVSQGRLLRGSTQGALLVERDRYLLGDMVVVRARLTDASYQPLETPRATLHVTRPDGTTQPVVLNADPARKGMYSGQFTVIQEGAHRLDLPVPESMDQQVTRHLQVKVPDLERDRPQRNDALLSEIARRTGGLYFIGLDAALGHRDREPLIHHLRDCTEVVMQVGSPDPQFARQLTMWLLAFLCSMLCLQWLIRRLCKLA
jgi:hypothetical protein